VALRLRGPVDEHRALGDEPLRRGPGAHLGKAGQEAVEALPRRGVRDAQAERR
jgi:hypothetical protein